MIWLQFGNCPTELIASGLRDRLVDVQTFVADSAKALLILSRIH